MGGSCPCLGEHKNDKESETRPKINEERDSKKPSSSGGSSSITKTTRGYSQNAARNKFTYEQLAKATDNFNDANVIGRGGFGTVYQGQLEIPHQLVAVKKLDPTSYQGDKEFSMEVRMLSLCRHRNLVRLIGSCGEDDHRILVYEYMPLGSVERHLFDPAPWMTPLDWNTRMKIAAGAAKGLEYLHYYADSPVIYRDFKTSNILLDEDYLPKLSDFGLAKFGPTDGRSHVSTEVMGTHGYCAPEYATTGRLTPRCDIFSFGVFLMEIITGRVAVDASRGRDKRMLIHWVPRILKEGKNISELADPNLKGQFSESILSKVLTVASMCVQEEPSVRPSTDEVAMTLGYFVSQPFVPPNAPQVPY